MGTASTSLQAYLVHAAQATVRQGWIDSVGLGRMVRSCPERPADSLAGCTTAPRNGLRSGCSPLDPYSKALPEAAEIKALEARLSVDP